MKDEIGDVFFKLTKRLMLIAGLTKSETGWVYYKHYAFIMGTICAVGVLFCVIQLKKSIEYNVADKINMLLLGVSTAVQVLIRIHACHSSEITTLIDEGTEKSNKSSKADRNIYRIYARFHRYSKILNTGTVICTVLTNVTHSAILIFDISKLQKLENSDDASAEIMKTLWLPFSPRQHGLLYFLASSVFIYIFLLNVAATTVAFSTILIYCVAQLKVLQYQFETFDSFSTDELDKANIEKTATHKLKFVIKEHQEIINYIGRINKCVKFSVFIQTSVSSAMIAINLTQILTGINTLFNIANMMMNVTSFVILSYCTNEIQLQSLNLGTAMYNSKWYERVPKTRKMIVTVILRCGTPLTINKGDFGPLTNETAVAVFKGAYSFTSFLSQM